MSAAHHEAAHGAAPKAQEHGQQHPLGVYFKIWALLFVLSAASYMVDYFHVQGLLRCHEHPPGEDEQRAPVVPAQHAGDRLALGRDPLGGQPRHDRIGLCERCKAPLENRVRFEEGDHPFAFLPIRRLP
mgnify:CR=1 FL=1